MEPNIPLLIYYKIILKLFKKLKNTEIYDINKVLYYIRIKAKSARKSEGILCFEVGTGLQNQWNMNCGHV